MPLLANIALFQVGWFACVLGAANGLGWAGSIAALTVAGLHLGFAHRPRLEMRLLLTAVVLGFAWDSFIAAAGLIAFKGGLTQTFAPQWIAALWLVFATTLNVSLRWLRQRQWLSALFGAVGAPLAYYAGARLGALSIPDPAIGLGAEALGWALLMPLLMRLATRFDGVAPRRVAEAVYVRP
ncbi:MAG: DUF2878 domain-containing protein [Gammaproteobacteria bacterium]